MSIQKNKDGFYEVLNFPEGKISDVFDRAALEMTVIHNLIIRAINSLLYHAPKITSSEVPAFMKYSHAFIQTVHHHHANEEELYFPMLEEKLGKGYMNENIAGHEAFHTSFDAFTALCDRVAAHPSKWDASTFIASVKSFSEPLTKHLAEEITTLDAATLRKSMTVADLEHCNRELEKKVKSEMSLSEFPLGITNFDNISGRWLMKLPLFTRILIAWVIIPLNGSVWKYGTSNGWGDLKPEFAWMSCSPPSP
ncbi:hypothetical protein DL96DRAFT_1706022 [Flagelloscypha sp. PMI_526]|nr:hypothetical protein DL96DRAFT_1706022 [Flagelloscypha sp. PMI_526]